MTLPKWTEESHSRWYRKCVPNSAIMNWHSRHRLRPHLFSLKLLWHCVWVTPPSCFNGWQISGNVDCAPLSWEHLLTEVRGMVQKLIQGGGDSAVTAQAHGTWSCPRRDPRVPSLGIIPHLGPSHFYCNLGSSPLSVFTWQLNNWFLPFWRLLWFMSYIFSNARVSCMLANTLPLSSFPF